MGYNPKALEEGIAKCKANIEVFEQAIEKERQTIKDYRSMIDQIEEKERLQKEIEKNVHIELDEDGPD